MWLFKIISSLFFFSICTGGYSQEISISDVEISRIAEKIFRNECGGKLEGLTSWNEGENFASLGIGHFIWYPKDEEVFFDESFPELLVFIKSKGIALPSWLKESSNPECPWHSREEFIKNLQSQKMRILREFLVDTILFQGLFMANRLQRSLAKMLEVVSKESYESVRRQFYRLANTPGGMYALIDYVNFKGEGVLKTESYNGEGWGLLQVLEAMKGTGSGLGALQEFSKVAGTLLTRRVNNAPRERNEQRWLPVWKRRIKTYIR